MYLSANKHSEWRQTIAQTEQEKGKNRPSGSYVLICKCLVFSNDSVTTLIIHSCMTMYSS